MIERHALGLFLRIDEERELFRAAALGCGLLPVDLTGLAPTAVFAPPLGANAAEWSNLPTGNLPQLIVTDELAGPWSLDPGSSFSQYDAPMLLLVRDKQQTNDATANFNDASAPVAILHRPLRLEIVIATLRQSASMISAFTRRHRFMVEDLHAEEQASKKPLAEEKV